MKNPFTLGLVIEEDSFCDRLKEKEDLIKHAKSGNKVVLCSPRRFGKSSLVQIVLSMLKKEDFLTAYVDLFPISSEKDFILRFANSIYKGIGKGIDPRTFIEKIKGFFTRIVPTIDVGQDGYTISAKYSTSENMELILDDLMEGLEKYVLKSKKRACIVLDEFQEITELDESKQIEGILRSHIQRQKDVSYFFVGSKRRTLMDMFSGKSRPFYKSAFFYTLSEIPIDEFAPYISELFQKTGKTCSNEQAREVYDLVGGYPYYVQKLSSIVWDETAKECSSEIIRGSFGILVRSETVDFEGIWSGLTLAQKKLLKAIAADPNVTLFSKNNLEKSGVSLGGIQKALKTLVKKDLVEKKESGNYIITDPIMSVWLKN